MQLSSDKAGFSLVELSVVLVVIALITGMTVAAGVGALESTKRAATINKMDEIEKALLAFRIKYGRLPCPADATMAPTDGIWRPLAPCAMAGTR